MSIGVVQESCVRCGRCMRVCPVGVFGRGQWGETTVVNALGCISCGHCVMVCPPEAIVHEMFTSGSLENVQYELLPTPRQLMELLRSRRSNRALSARTIPEEAIHDILEAAHLAPTAENSHRVAVTFLDDEEGLQHIEDCVMRFFLRLSKVLMSWPLRRLTKRILPDLYNEAPELARFAARWRAGERPCLCNCKALLAFSAPSGYDFAYADCNLAYQNASLMAETHGVSQIYMGLIFIALRFMGKRRQRVLLHLPSGHQLFALMGIGMPLFRFPRYVRH